MLLISFPKEKLFREIQALLLFMVGKYRVQENHHLFRSFTELDIRPFRLELKHKFSWGCLRDVDGIVVDFYPRFIYINLIYGIFPNNENYQIYYKAVI